MKSKLLLFFSCLAMGALVACDGLGGLVPDGGGSNGDSSGQQGGGIGLPDTMEQAFNKFYQLGKEQGFEVTFNSVGEDDSGQTVRESDTVGFKNDVLWIQGESAYKELNSGLEYYQYDTQKQSYEYQGSVQYSLQTIAQQFTSQFYAGYQYVSSAQGSLTDVKDVTVAGRAAKEYTFAYTALDAVGTLKLVFDNQTGITLKIYGTAATGSETSSAEFEVTSFKVGGQVTVPTLHKDNGGGQGGEGGEGGETTNVFSNKLLMYVSNENYNVFNGSQLALFSDGKFELVFYENAYLVVMFGEYTVAATNTSAALSAKKVYKEQGKQYSDINQSWTLSYASGGYTLQVTSTGKVNYMASAVPPTHADIPSEGGQGGHGETGEESRFVDKKFDCFRDNGATMYANSSICIFQDGTFELSFKENNKLVVYLGEYDINEADTVATLSVKKVYKEQTSSYTVMSQSWSFAFVNEIYTLTISASVKVDYEPSNGQPVHADIPNDPNGNAGQEDQRFIVSGEVWASMIEEADIVKMNSNFQAMVTSSDNQGGYTKYQFDNGKVRVESKSADGTYEYYYEYTDSGNYYYYQDNYAAWIKENNPLGSNIGTFNNSLGIIRVPFNKVTYSKDSHEYVCSSWQDQYGDTYQNVHIGFEDGNLHKISYTHWGIYRETECMLYGSTTVTLPQEGGGNHPTQEQLDDLVRNKVYVYDSALDNDHQLSADTLNSYFSGNKISFFTDNSVELTYQRVVDYATGTVQQSVMTLIGTYQVQEDTQLEGKNYIRLNIDKVVIDGYLKQENVNETMRVLVKPNENQVTIWEYDSSVSLATYYALNSSARPEHVSYETEPPAEAKWPADDIAAKLRQLEINVTLPAPYNNDDNIVSVTDVIDGETLKIEITLVSQYAAMAEFYGYIAEDNADFVMDYVNTNIENGLLVYTNKAKDVRLTLAWTEGSSVVSIVVSKIVVSGYPSDDIVAYFRTNNIQGALPSLEMENVSYNFNASEGLLSMTPLGENTAQNIKDTIDSILLRNGFKVIYMEDYYGNLNPMYIDRSYNYFVSVCDSYFGDGDVWAMIGPADEEMKSQVFFEYPEQLINSSYAAGVRDALPSFAIDGAVYSFFEMDEGYELEIFIQQSMDAEKLVTELGGRLEGAGYVESEGVYTSANGQILVSLSTLQDKVICVDIQYVFEEADVVYTLVNTNDWDITGDHAQLYAYVWDNKGNSEWIPLEQNEDGTFTVEISNVYIGIKIVRFAPESEIDWAGGPDGSVNEGVIIWNQTGDIKLNGLGGRVEFFLEG